LFTAAQTFANVASLFLPSSTELDIQNKIPCVPIKHFAYISNRSVILSASQGQTELETSLLKFAGSALKLRLLF
jgi:hypothetical protein